MDAAGGADEELTFSIGNEVGGLAVGPDEGAPVVATGYPWTRGDARTVLATANLGAIAGGKRLHRAGAVGHAAGNGAVSGGGVVPSSHHASRPRLVALAAADE